MNTPHRFIVVDDDPMNNLICRYSILKFDSEADIQLFTDPENALVMIKNTFGNPVENKETVLFLDINMPTMSGWEFLDEFEKFKEEIHDQIKIYILSSSIDQNDKDKAEMNSLIKGYIPKPLDVGLINEIFN